MNLYAHTSGSSEEEWQTLDDHLASVANLASCFAAPFKGEEVAYQLGLLHDLGKASDEFQRLLQGKEVHVDHSTAGGQFLYECDKNPKHSAAYTWAPLILGHHKGLENYLDSENRLKKTDIPNYKKNIDQLSISEVGICFWEVVEKLINKSTLETLSNEQKGNFLKVVGFIFNHLLFSSLVDADWLDTEQVMNPETAELRKSKSNSIEELQDIFTEYMNKFLSSLSEEEANTPVNKARAQVNKDCEVASVRKTGIYTLKVPTGGGKTLASMKFALNHALQNKQNRIIYAIPYTSIVEQTSDIFHSIFGEVNVAEHSSNTDYEKSFDGEALVDDEEARRRLVVQNWEAPIIVTTNVQLFESLFSNKTSRSRKVHNIANSVIILDEVQTLPNELLKPTLAAMEVLSKIANVSFVLCSATQPNLEECFSFSSKVENIITDYPKLAKQLDNRVRYKTNLLFNPVELDNLAGRILQIPQVLCVVNSKKLARELYERVRNKTSEEGIYHLSAFMTPSHRSSVFEEIKHRLALGKQCRVISTQLIEAGVDLDFPVVFREIAGIDSILQAAGRCNREGKLKEKGTVEIFEIKDSEVSFKTASSIERAKSITKTSLEALKINAEEGVSDEAVGKYFSEFRQGVNLDEKDVFTLITQEDASMSSFKYKYKTISDQYKFISDDTYALFVPFDKEGQEALKEIESNEFSYRKMNIVRRSSISLSSYQFKILETMKMIRHFANFPIPVLETRLGSRLLYKHDVGLDLSGKTPELDDLVF